MPIVTSYVNLGEEGLRTSLAETCAKAIFLDSQLLPTLFKSLPSSSDLQLVIYFGSVPPQDLSTLREANPSLKVFQYENVVEVGKAHPVDPTPPSPSDLVCIMYTSGSWGQPKGVLLTHRNIVSAGNTSLI
jgi:long-chain acyl-CoA synthetase